MDDHRFDALTRSLASRRAAVGGLLAALPGVAILGTAAAKKKKRKKCKPKCPDCQKCVKGKCKPQPNGTACGAGQTCTGGTCGASACPGGQVTRAWKRETLGQVRASPFAVWRPIVRRSPGRSVTVRTPRPRSRSAGVVLVTRSSPGRRGGRRAPVVESSVPMACRDATACAVEPARAFSAPGQERARGAVSSPAT